MENCEQTQGLSVLAHGQSVWSFYQDLTRHLRDGTNLAYPWKLPDWVYDSRLLERQLDPITLQNYMVFHDCGKPYCRQVDEEGRVHFPDHARLSEETWRSIGGNDQVARLMGMDMDVHLLKGTDVESFAQREEAASLLLAGLSEIHSNAEMFGGIDSVSFKMKWKHLNRRGKAILKAFA